MDEVTRGGPLVRLLAIVLAAAALACGDVGTILVLRPAGANFEEARKGIAEALGSDFAVREILVDKATSADEVASSWKAAPPKAVVAMDNRAIGLFRDARSRIGDTSVPVVALMGVRVDAAIRGIPNAVSISYEIPAVTALVDLRSVLSTPLKRVGMVYRSSMEDMFRRNAEFCREEDIELVGRSVPDGDGRRAGLESALQDLVRNGNVDALVVVNDNAFINVEMLRQVWLPVLSEWKRPIVVGVESLVRPELRFGTFAILPDHYALGTQAAGLIEELAQAGWKTDSTRSEEPLSVIKVVNQRGMERCCRLRPDKESEIDKVLR
jgi:hypothetical protein